MAALGRKFGIVGFVFSVGVACTQLLGDQPNTLAPVNAARPPSITGPMLQPLPGDRPVICASGARRCEGALLQTCSDDLTAWITVESCGAAALCQPDPATCVEATCSEDEMTCAGALLQKCNADRTGWDLFATCLSPAHCNADQRQCLPEACAAGQRRCDRSDLDQSPSLEVCRDDRLDWGPLDACVTRELCDQTLTSGTPGGGLIVGSDGMVQVQTPVSPDTLLRCNLPACAAGEVRCSGVRLEYCSEGRTGWLTAEECASEALCEGSLGNVGSTGAPVCLPPACGAGQHQCTAGGVLQVCSEDRTGFRDLENCEGAPFCNAAAADQGQPGCRDIPCEAGQMQCNGAQVQVCRDDRTALDDVGAPCESTALCNADDPLNAFCDPPTCRRGATSGTEFQCDGAELQRCNGSLTDYDTIQTCATAALCDPSQRASGCRPPACGIGTHECRNGFLRTCNQDRTAFEDTENCGSQAQCDASAGRCADPCEPGSTRCNESNGDIERCTDRLTGWQPIADCPNAQLCDLANLRCDICLGGQFSCADGQLRQCSADGGTFSRQNIGPECAPAAGGGVGVRVCQGNSVAITPCPFGCTNGRCNECQGNETQCVGNSQIRRCNNGFFGAPTACSDGNACNGAESCQNNACVGGAPLACNDNNRCTNDTCNPGTGCQFAPANNQPAQCVNGALQTCVNGQLQSTQCGQAGCVNGRCANCTTGACDGNRFIACNGGQTADPVPCPDDNNPCTAVSCSAQGGCGLTNLSNVSCADTDRCDGAETCQNGVCQAGARVTCNEDTNPCTTVACNANSGTCATTNTGGACPGGTCQGSTCVPTQICTPNGNPRCQNGVPQRCNAQGTAFVNVVNSCDDGNACTTDGCNAQNATCTHTNVTCQEDNNPCATVSCNPNNGNCAPNDVPNGTRCSDNNACTGDETCQDGRCNNPADINCGQPAVCRTVSCNPGDGRCITGNQNDGDPCSGGSCRGGSCIANCTGAACTQGGEVIECVNGRQAAPRNCPDDNANNPCVAPSCATGVGCRLVDVTGGNCSINGVAGTCQTGTCRPNCTGAACTQGGQVVECVNGQQAAPRNCPDDTANNPCIVPTCRTGVGCGLVELDNVDCTTSTGRSGLCELGVCLPDGFGLPPGTCVANSCSDGVETICEARVPRFNPCAAGQVCVGDRCGQP